MFMRVAKNVMRTVCRSPMFDWGVRFIDRWPQRHGRLLRVLTYHRVDEIETRSDLDPSLISATPRQFEAQLRWLAKEFELVSLDDVLDDLDGRYPLPKRAVLITFDDAYTDFATNAWPILRECSAPSVLFVPTGYPDEPQRIFWWDRLYNALVRSETAAVIETPFGKHEIADIRARRRVFRDLKQRLKSLPHAEMQQALDSVCAQCQADLPAPAVMGWTQLMTLADAGVALVPHTHTHPLLDRVPIDSARDEIRRSRQMLEEKIGNVPPAFAYPSGQFDESVVSALRDEGFRLAFTTMRGVNDLQISDPMTMRRCNVGRQTPDALIRLQLTAFYRHLN